MSPLPLSVLDLSPVVTGASGAVSLRNSLDLARLADRLGYKRYWVAKHHNLPSVASSTPEIMIGQIAAATERIRVGSGGVMLSAAVTDARAETCLHCRTSILGTTAQHALTFTLELH